MTDWAGASAVIEPVPDSESAAPAPTLGADLREGFAGAASATSAEGAFLVARLAIARGASSEPSLPDSASVPVPAPATPVLSFAVGLVDLTVRFPAACAAASDGSSIVAVAVDGSCAPAFASAAPANHSRTVSARPTETLER